LERKQQAVQVELVAPILMNAKQEIAEMAFLRAGEG
jgi:hypothetical protein